MHCWEFGRDCLSVFLQNVFMLRKCLQRKNAPGLGIKKKSFQVAETTMSLKPYRHSKQKQQTEKQNK